MRRLEKEEMYGGFLLVIALTRGTYVTGYGENRWFIVLKMNHGEKKYIKKCVAKA